MALSASLMVIPRLLWGNNIFDEIGAMPIGAASFPFGLGTEGT